MIREEKRRNGAAEARVYKEGKTEAERGGQRVRRRVSSFLQPLHEQACGMSGGVPPSVLLSLRVVGE